MEKTRKVLARMTMLAALALAGGCGHHAPPAAKPAPIHSASSGSRSKSTQEGVASFYGKGFAGRPTASGETFDPSEMTCAHRTLPFGTWLRVTNLGNGKSVDVRVNDRGPFTGRRVLDLSEGAARHLDMIASGTAKVRIEVIPATALR